MDLHALWGGGLNSGKYFVLDIVDDRESRYRAAPVNRSQYRWLAVGAHNILLHHPSVADVRHVAHEDNGIIHNFDWHIVERQRIPRTVVETRPVFAAANLDGAGRHRDILRSNGIFNVHRGQPLGQQCLLVEVNHDLAYHAAVRGREQSARNHRYLLTYAEDAVVVEFRLRQRVARECKLINGDRGGAEAQYPGRIHACGKAKTDGLYGCAHLS